MVKLTFKAMQSLCLYSLLYNYSLLILYHNTESYNIAIILVSLLHNSCVKNTNQLGFSLYLFFCVCLINSFSIECPSPKCLDLANTYSSFKYYLLFVCVYERGAFIPLCLQRSEANFVKLILSFHLYIHSRNISQVMEYAQKAPLSIKLFCWTPTHLLRLKKCCFHHHINGSISKQGIGLEKAWDRT